MANEIVRFSVAIEDSDNSISRIPIRVQYGTTPSLAAIQTTADALATQIDAVILGKVVAVDGTIELVVPAGPAGKTVVANVHVEIGANLAFETTLGVGETFYIPTFTAALMPGKTVNDQDTDVAALLASIKVGIDGVTNSQVVNGDNAQINTYRKGYQTSRKTKR